MRVPFLGPALFCLLLPLGAAADGMSTPYIQVQGHGEMRVEPDILYVSLTLEKSAPDAKGARAEVESRTAKVIAAARKQGIADKDIQARGINVYPEYGRSNRIMSSSEAEQEPLKVVAQHVTRQVTLTLRDLGRYGELVDALFDAGVTRLDQVTPDRSDRTALQNKALQLAVQDAHDKASSLARGAGVNLGAVFSIAEQGGGYSPRPIMMARAEASASTAAPEYLPGLIEIDADVAVYYMIGK
ncbi:MAG: SIMPL domain-containing protein [Bacillota bacterium]